MERVSFSPPASSSTRFSRCSPRCYSLPSFLICILLTNTLSFLHPPDAWTSVDHTCYTISTAGSEGFLNLLPVYLDHILRPTITESAFNTEVHHITGEGENAGVVYCEMANHENSEDSLLERALLAHLFEDTGYSADTGGRLPNLRTLTVEKVREYHRSFYRPQNLCLIITGKVDHEELFSVLGRFQDSLKKNSPATPIPRPWTSVVPSLDTSVTTQVEFPTDDEETGSATIAWRTTAFNYFEHQTAIDILFEYLTKGALSPLQQQLVEIEDPYCSDVSFDISIYTTGSIVCTLPLRHSALPLPSLITHFTHHFSSEPVLRRCAHRVVRRVDPKEGV
jgi:Zn-dependent M16 (insulinase) family peptidase